MPEPLAGPKLFMRSTAWLEFDTMLGQLADSAQRLTAAYASAPQAGVVLGVALQLALAEKILKELGQFKTELEPVIAEFRAASALVDSQSKETSGDVH